MCGRHEDCTMAFSSGADEIAKQWILLPPQQEQILVPLSVIRSQRTFQINEWAEPFRIPPSPPFLVLTKIIEYHNGGKGPQSSFAACQDIAIKEVSPFSVHLTLDVAGTLVL
ncbi:UNVERIFIED_CONTAM: hypothetical protein K2H54_038423 [Gekko kuhli]